MSIAGRTGPAPSADPTVGLGRRILRWLVQHWWLVMAGVVGFHLLAWTITNPQHAQVNWILFTSDSPVGLVITVAVLFGALASFLISRQRRHPSRRDERQAGAASGSPLPANRPDSLKEPGPS